MNLFSKMWVLLTFAVAFLWALVNVLDKHVVSDELKDPALCVVVYGILAFFMYSAINFALRQSILFSAIAKFAAFGAGVALGIGVWLYYVALKREEVSRVLPLLNFNPLFTLLLATLFLNEFFTPERYLGIGLLIGGAFLISIKEISKRRKKVISLTTLLIIITAAFAFASRSVLVRFATLSASFFLLLFWIGLGLLLVALVSLAFHHPKIRQKLQLRGFKHLIFINLLSVATLLLYIKAIELAPAVSLVTALGSLQGLFVFLFATVLTKLKVKLDGRIVREPLTKKVLLLKLVAVALLTAGAALIV